MLTVLDIPEEAVRNNLVEICVRRKDSRFKDFLKVALSSPEEKNNDNYKEALSKVVSNIYSDYKRNKIHSFNDLFLSAGVNVIKQIDLRNVNVLKVLSPLSVKVSKETVLSAAASAASAGSMSALAIGLNAGTLVATAAGFAVLNNKIKNLSAEVRQIKEDLENGASKADIETLGRFNNAVNTYIAILDKNRIGVPVSEDEYVKVINEIHGVLFVLNSIFKENVSNNESMLEAIYILTPMMAHLISELDKEYYFNHKDCWKGKPRWHSLHSRWMSVIDDVMSQSFVDNIMDHYMLKAHRHNSEAVETAAASVYSAGKAKLAISDMQQILLCCQDRDDYQRLMTAIDNEADEMLKEDVIEAITTSDIEQEYAQVLSKKLDEFCMSAAL